MTLQLLHSKFPYIWGKFDFLFYQCSMRGTGTGVPGIQTLIIPLPCRHSEQSPALTPNFIYWIGLNFFTRRLGVERNYHPVHFVLCCFTHRIHRVTTAAFWRTFSDEGKISPGWWGWGVHAHPLSLHLPSPVKLQCTLQLSGQIHWPCFISTNICTLWFYLPKPSWWSTQGHLLILLVY